MLPANKSSRSKLKTRKTGRKKSSLSAEDRKLDHDSECESEFQVHEAEMKKKINTDKNECSDKREKTENSEENISTGLCHFCGKELKRKYDLDRHISRVHASRECEKCKQNFKSFRLLTEHMKYEHDVGPKRHFTKECLECHRLFQTKQQLQNHMSLHTNAILHQCDVCGKMLKSTASLKFHMKARHGGHSEELRKHSCELCSKKFYFKNDLIRHLRTHSDEKPYVCEICKATFRYPSNLSQHIRSIHQGIKYTCEICDQDFASKTNLNQHSKKHRPDYVKTKIPCDQCGSCFSFKGDLVKHMTIHTGERPFMCIVCDKTFRLKSHLKQHESVHTGLKPFKCKFCAKGFSQRANVLCHERKQCKMKDGTMRNKSEQTSFDEDMMDDTSSEEEAKIFIIDNKTDLENSPNLIQKVKMKETSNREMVIHDSKNNSLKEEKRTKDGHPKKFENLTTVELDCGIEQVILQCDTENALYTMGDGDMFILAKEGNSIIYEVEQIVEEGLEQKIPVDADTCVHVDI